MSHRPVASVSCRGSSRHRLCPSLPHGMRLYLLDMRRADGAVLPTFLLLLPLSEPPSVRSAQMVQNTRSACDRREVQDDAGRGGA
ncbi:MAG: hypothetical protein F4Z46_00040 [Cenarchaeum sp. SB0667_bin_13]|nr:hypothetical protein [Cenarchaeum sp. SB0667_bin_13]